MLSAKLQKRKKNEMYRYPSERETKVSLSPFQEKKRGDGCRCFVPGIVRTSSPSGKKRRPCQGGREKSWGEKGCSGVMSFHKKKKKRKKKLVLKVRTTGGVFFVENAYIKTASISAEKRGGGGKRLLAFSLAA